MRLALVCFACCIPAAAAPPLADATENQNSRFRAAFDTVEKWIRDGAFPGAVLAVGRSALVALKAFGRSEYTPESPAMTVNEIFEPRLAFESDGATTAAAILIETRKLRLDDPVVRYVHEFGGVPGHE